MSVTLPDRRAVRLAPGRAVRQGLFRLTFAGKWSILVNEGGIRDKRLAPIMGYKPVLESLHIRTGYFYHLCLFRLRRRRVIMSMIIRMTLSAKSRISYKLIAASKKCNPAFRPFKFWGQAALVADANTYYTVYLFV